MTNSSPFEKINQALSQSVGKEPGSPSKILILGYGNPDRQDDGVAWHILIQLARQFGRTVPVAPEEGFHSMGYPVEMMFALQLTPEMSETVAKFDRVCFVDAHTGNVPELVHFEKLEPNFRSSPFTHHMTPSTCLALASTLYSRQPEAILVSVRGFAFGFERELSDQTRDLSTQAVNLILDWIHPGKSGK